MGGAILMNPSPPGSGFDPCYIQTDAPVTLANQSNSTFAVWAKPIPDWTPVNPRLFCPPGSHWVLWKGTVGLGFWYYIPASIQPSADVWHHFAVTYDRPSGKYSIYVDGDFQATGPTSPGDGIRNAPGAVRWIIGHAEDTKATYEGDQWKGWLDDARIYNRILSASDVRELVALAPDPLPVVINQNPVAEVTQYEGDPALSLKVTLSSGTLPVYQWYKNQTTPIEGATNSSLAISSTSASESGSYTVVISNSLGAVTSSPPSVVTITPVADPINTALLLNYKFDEQSGTAIADSSGKNNNATLYGDWAAAWEPGRVNGALVLNNGPAGSYTVTARNTAGSVTSDPPVTVTILTPPSTGYMAAILADAPEAYWRLDDTDSTLRDTMGRHHGTYLGSVAQDSTPGALAGDSSPCVTFGGAANFASVPASTDLNGTYVNADFSMECWASLPPGTTGLKRPFYTRSGGDGCGFFSFDTGCQVQYWRNPPNTWGAIYQANSLRDGNWHHLVATYNKAANTMKFYLDGFLVGTDTTANLTLITSPNVPVQIGSWASYDWPGNVDEVAWYNQTLSSDRVVAHYNLGLYGSNVPLGITAHPQSQTVLVGSPVQFTVQASGLPPFQYQWKRNGVNIPNATNNSYSIPIAYFTDAATYSATVSHLASSLNSADAVLTVIPEPCYVQMTNGLVVHLTFDGDCNDSSVRGNSATPQGAPDYVAGIVGTQALHYWTDTASGSYNYASLTDTSTMASAWPDLMFDMGGWSASYWIKLPDYSRVPFLCSSVGGVRPTGDYHNAGGFAMGCEFSSGLPGGGGTVELWVNGGFCWAVTNDFASDQWRHIAVTKAGADSNFRVKLYVDGVPNPDPWGYGATTDSPNPWNIGQDGTGYMNVDGSGVMDDLGVWNRELTPLEVYSILTVGRKGNSLNQVAPVKLNVQQVGSSIDVSWQAGTLLLSTSVNGTYSPVPNATAPFYRTSAAGTAIPGIEAVFNELLGGCGFVKPPLAFVAANETDLSNQIKAAPKVLRGVAGDLYLPMAFARGCKITLDQVPFYYIIN
jgi:hypothetical protein